MRIELEAFGEVQLSRELLRFRDNAMDMRPAFDDVHDLFIKHEQKQFQTQGRYASGGWTPLAPTTVAAKRRKRRAGAGGDPRILHDTLRLRGSLTDKGHPDHVYRASADEMFVGSTVEYGVHHQFGAPEANLPRRRPVEFRDTHKRNIMKILQSHLVGGSGLL